MAKVVLLFGNDPQAEFSLGKDEHRIGRARDCEILVDNLGVSRHHCSIVKDGDGWKVVDKGSNNGTFINGQQVSEHVLKNGDRIVLGKFNLVYDAFGYAEPTGGRKQSTGMGAEMTMFMDPEAIQKMQAQLKPGQGDRMVLSMIQGDREANCPLVKTETTIGKGVEADVPAKGLFVKTIQATVVRADKGYVLRGAGGLRAVRVNGKKVVQETPLTPGDRISIGSVTIVFKKG